MVIQSRIDFKSPRQKMWGIISNGNLVSRPYGHETDAKGYEISGIATNCYSDVLDEAKVIIAGGVSTSNVQIVEFVPYDFLMQPNV